MFVFCVSFHLSITESCLTDKWQRLRLWNVGNHLTQLAQVLGFPCLPPHFLHNSKLQPQLKERPLMASNTEVRMGSPSMVSTACVQYTTMRLFWHWSAWTHGISRQLLLCNCENPNMKPSNHCAWGISAYPDGEQTLSRLVVRNRHDCEH